jgi:hypothetical protein
MSGTRNNQGKRRWRNLPMFLLRDVIAIGEVGEKNHSTWNFLKGFPISDTLDSLKRHLDLFESPYESDFDEETKINHLAHIAWNALAALHTYKHHPELDDRYKEPKQNLTIFTTEDQINNMVKHKDKFIATMGEQTYHDALNSLMDYKNPHTGSSFDDFLKELESSYEEASTKVEDTLDKEDIIQDLKYPYMENSSSVPSGRSRGQSPGLNKEQFLKFSADIIKETIHKIDSSLQTDIESSRCRGSMSGKPSACGCGDCS